MKIDKGSLLRAVKKVMPGVGKSQLLDGADTIIFSEIGLHSFNSSVSVTVPFDFPEPIQGSVKGSDLFKILSDRRLKVISDEFELKVTENGMKFNGASWSGSLSWMEDAEWLKDKIDTLSNVTCGKELSHDFAEGINLCSIKGDRTKFNGVYVKKGAMYGTNRAVVNFFELYTPVEDEFWIGQGEANEFLKISNINKDTVFTHYECSDSRIGHWINLKDTEGTIFSVALRDTSYYKAALDFLENNVSIKPIPGGVSGELPVGFADAVSTCNLMASASQKGKKFVDIIFMKDQMIIKGKRSGGKLQNTLEFDEESQLDMAEEELKYRFISDNIVDASRKTKQFFINKSSDSASCVMVLYTDGFKTMIPSLKVDD